MTCEGNTVFSMVVMTENPILLEELLVRKTFDPRRIVWKDVSRSDNYFLSAHAVSSAGVEKKTKKVEMTREDMPCGRSVGEPLASSTKSNNALQEVLKKKWLAGMTLLRKHMPSKVISAYMDILFNIIHARWFEGLKVLCMAIRSAAIDNEGVEQEMSLNLNHVNAQGLAPLHAALEIRWNLGVSHLIKIQSVDINKRSHSGQTPLHKALDDGNLEVVMEILQHRKDDVDVNTTDTKCQMPIHKALHKGHSEIIHLLLSFPQLDLLSYDRYIILCSKHFVSSCYFQP